MNNDVIDKDLLIDLYVNKEMAMNKIASYLEVSVGKVFNYIKRYGIEPRKTLTEAQRNAISNSNKGRPCARKGTHLSAETKLKLSEAHKLKGAGHKKARADGYIYLYYPSHPKSTKDGYIPEHHYVMEQSIGRYINKGEVVHHKNHIRDDNRIENLELMTFKEHASLHMKERWAIKKGEMTYQ